MTQTEAKALALVAVGKIEAKTAVDQQKRDQARQAMLSDDEAENLLVALQRCRSRENRSFTTEEAMGLINEAVNTRFMSSCFDLVLKGLLDVDYIPGNPPDERLVFKSRKDIEPTLREALQRRAEDGR